VPAVLTIVLAVTVAVELAVVLALAVVLFVVFAVNMAFAVSTSTLLHISNTNLLLPHVVMHRNRPCQRPMAKIFDGVLFTIIWTVSLILR